MVGSSGAEVGVNARSDGAEHSWRFGARDAAYGTEGALEGSPSGRYASEAVQYYTSVARKSYVMPDRLLFHAEVRRCYAFRANFERHIVALVWVCNCNVSAE